MTLKVMKGFFSVKIFYSLLILVLMLNYEIKAATTRPYTDLLQQIMNGDFKESTSTAPPDSTTRAELETMVDITKNNKSGKLTEKNYTSCGNGKLCVPFYQCTENGTYNIDGSKIINIRFDDTKKNIVRSDSKEGCGSFLEICCKIERESIDETLRIPEVLIEMENTCGIRNYDGLIVKFDEGEITDESEYSEFPWMIAVFKSEQLSNESYEIFICGGSLIHPSVVLTAAHCVYKYNANKLMVRAGEWDLTQDEEPYKVQDRKINEKILHEKYSRSGMYNDIALLFTSEPFQLASHINTICLPPLNMNLNQDDTCYSNGWGKDQYGPEGNYRNILKKIGFKVMPSNNCETKLKEIKHIRDDFKLHDSFICANSEMGKDLCIGDGGGPLSCPIPGKKGRFYLTGISSWGKGCDGKYPNVFVHVSYLREWIDNILEMKNLNSVYYTAL